MSGRGPAVSIVLPVRDAAATLDAALDSIAGQTFRDWECIAVDDGSRDRSAELLRERAAADPRFTAICREHAGIVAALTAGIAAARAPLIARMDADDRSAPERLEDELALLAENGDVGVASCLVRDVPGCPSPGGFASYIAWTNGIVTPDEHRLNRFVESPVIHPTVVFRRELVDRLGGYREDPPWPEDYELWLRWLGAGVAFAKVPQVLYEWREGARRLSRTDARYGPDAFYACKAHYLAAGPLRGCRAVGVWGAGRIARKRAELLTRHGIAIAFYVDIDPDKIGRAVHGRPVVSPADLDRVPDLPLLSYVASRGARDAIRAAIGGSRYREGENFWCVA